ncbi:NAD(P)-dependent oxidoreductase [Natronospirillum operosum]|uniref:NAD(P)-dependent oxidoreductase n=1 Tax=Natronospirillum operosum TaxID=2759953 RepID=A0A4Z0WD15_9GAMM|nr:NAD(P)-binding domain-containing protein [Natronospirillum operosum]TGG91712.1 NAD(P)-dependent oxidoreductase [Natronospirillum operosum]
MNNINITIIGLGAMGTAVAKAFLEKDFTVTVWSRSPQKAQPLVAQGARHAEVIDEALEASPLLLISVLDYPAVDDIFRPMSKGRLAGKTVVNLTNGTPEEARKMAAWADAQGADYIDGGIMVTPELIGQPEAFVLYSGAEDSFRAVESTLSILGNPAYVGEDPAFAPLYDLSLLSAMFGMFGGYLHAAALLRSEKIPVFEGVPMIMALLKAMIELFPEIAREIDNREYPTPSSNNAMMATALRKVLDGSREQGVRGALMEPVWQLFHQGTQSGQGERDISALVPLLFAAHSEG